MKNLINLDTEKTKKHTESGGYFFESNEIDLVEIFSIFFRAKKIIFLITLTFAITGLTVGAFLPQKWTSSSVIIAPTDRESMSLDNLLGELKVAGVDSGIDRDYLLTTYMMFFDSRILKDKFLQQTDYFKVLMKDNLDEKFKNLSLIDDFINKNIITESNANDKPTTTKNYNYFRLKFSAQTPDDAKNLLQDYINYVEKSTREFILFKLQRSVALKLEMEKKLLSLAIQKFQSSRDVRIKRLEYALSIAEVAGVKKPVYSSGAAILDDPDYPITLGADALKQKIIVEKSIKDPLSISEELRKVAINIKFLQNIKADNIKFMPFKYIQKPELPTKKDEPKRLLILIIFIFMGLIVSFATALIRDILIKRRKMIA